LLFQRGSDETIVFTNYFFHSCSIASGHFQGVPFADMGSVAQLPIQLRTAIPEDVAAIVKLGADVFTATFGHSVSEEELQKYLNESYTIAAITNDLADTNKDMLVATGPDGTTVVGFAQLTRGTSEPCLAHLDNFVELQRIYVGLEYHGQGVGKMLAQRLEGMAKEEGFRHIWLGVWEENLPAQGLYKKLGYKIVGDHDFVVGTVVQTDHIMVKDLYQGV
jgi:ribosomal protein S18 acetylase RimI-like enzyme